MWIREFDSTFSFKPQVPCLFKLQHLQRVGLGACALGAASGSLAPWLRTATNLRVANLRRNATWRHAEFKLSLKGSNFSTCLLLSDPSHYMIVWLYRFLFDSITVSFFFVFWNRRSLWHNANCWQTRLLKALRCWSSLWQQMRQHQRCWAGTRTCARWSKHFHWISMDTEHRHPLFPQQQAGDSLGKASWI